MGADGAAWDTGLKACSGLRCSSFLAGKIRAVILDDDLFIPNGPNILETDVQLTRHLFALCSQ